LIRVLRDEGHANAWVIDRTFGCIAIEGDYGLATASVPQKQRARYQKCGRRIPVSGIRDITLRRFFY